MLANGAEEDDDEAQGGALDCDPDQMDHLNFEQARKLYVKLRREQKRSEIYKKNLERKMQKLKVDLDDKTESVEGLQRTLQLEQRKHEEESRSMQKEHEFKARAQEERIRELLSEVLYTKPSNSKKLDYELETVMVSFVRSDNFRYNLAFRVDGRTTVTELCNSACRYWGVSKEDYVLKTMASNKCQDEILVKQCFKQGEIAQLRLEKKRLDPTSTPTDDELKAIQPKVQKKKQQQQRRAKYDADGVNAIQKQHDNYNVELSRMGGSYFLLRTKNTKPSEHCAKIKIRDIIIWTALVVLTFYGYWLRRPTGYDYWLLKGFEEEVVRPFEPTNSTSDDGAPGVSEVHTVEELWRWLEFGLPKIVLAQNETASLRTYNMLLGYVAIRAQNVRNPLTPTTNCEAGQDELVESLQSRGAVCYHDTLQRDDQETRDFTAVQAYWDQKIALQATEEVAVRLRGPTKPYQWYSAAYNEEHHHLSSLRGYDEWYDAGGYMAEYNMGVFDKRHEYEEDVQTFRQLGWISQLTRVVIVSFSAYNFAYDKWVACDIIFSLAPSGAVEGQTFFQPFRPKIDETHLELTETYIDYARLVIIFYIGIFVGMSERHHKIKNHKAGCWYHVSSNGICDLGSVACMLCVVIWRNVEFSRSSTKAILERATDLTGDDGFYSFSSQAHSYRQILCVEGLLMVFLMFRVLSFFRLNRTVYLLWHTFGMALKAFLFFCALFIPTFVGFVLVAHTIYGPYLDDYATVNKTILQFYKLLEGDLEIELLMALDTIWAVVIIVVFYVMINFFLLNVFIALVVDAYYVVQVTQGTPGDKWSTMKKVRWFLPGIIVNIYQSLTSTSSAEGG